ncbi:MAG: peptide chain release factor N(5)-glutamine methyltransferase [Armatimonadota bacterium]
MTLGDWIPAATQRLEQAGIASPRLEAQLLAAHVLLVDRTYILTHPEAEFNELAGETLLQRREAQEPLAYILGYREFYGRKFRVTPSVLIPRQETELLIEEALQLSPGTRTPPSAPRPKGGVTQHSSNSQPPTSNSPTRVLDIGTGSGCIAITLKLERPEWDVWAVDISGAALQVARENAETLGAEITFRHSDLFSGLEGEKFDLILSNPPYIGVEEPLPDEIKNHEPPTALFADNQGLKIYQQLAATYRDYLTEEGTIILEIGQTQGKAVAELFNGQILKDLSGNDRAVARYPRRLAGKSDGPASGESDFHPGQGFITKKEGDRLPHWTQDSAIYHVTFRLADSLPKKVLQEMLEERERLSRIKKLSPDSKRALDYLYSERIEDYLDSGAGECLMKQPNIADLVAEAIRHFQGERYELHAWCVMPNHVHLLIEPLQPHELPAILHSLKSFSSHAINKHLSRSGARWMPEYYDHIIRTEPAYRRVIEYIQQNPRKAGLPGWKWVAP